MSHDRGFFELHTTGHQISPMSTKNQRLNISELSRVLRISRSSVNSYAHKPDAPRPVRGRYDLREFVHYLGAVAPRIWVNLPGVDAAEPQNADPDRVFDFSRVEEWKLGLMRIGIQLHTDAVLEALLDVAAPVLAHKSKKQVTNTLGWVLHFARQMADSEFGVHPCGVKESAMSPDQAAACDRDWQQKRAKALSIVARIAEAEDVEKAEPA